VTTAIEFTGNYEDLSTDMASSSSSIASDAVAVS